MKNTDSAPPASSSPSEFDDSKVTQLEGIETIASAVDDVVKKKTTVQAVLDEYDSSLVTLHLLKQKKRGVVIETSLYIMLIVGASLFLAFAFLAVSVHHTYPGFKIKYSSTPGAFRLPTLPNVLLFPNGSSSLQASSDPEEGGNTAYTLDDGLYIQPKASPAALNLRLIEVAKLGPTLFPILFAGGVGNTLRLIARWRVENGLSVEKLEVLIGSTSLARTMSILFSLSSLGLLEICLIFLWVLSPLAGQASLRVLEQKNITDTPAIGFLWRAVNPTYVSTSAPLPYARADYIDTLYECQTKFNGMDLTSASEQAKGDLADGPLFPLIAHDDSWFTSITGVPSNIPIIERPGNANYNYTSFVGFHNLGPQLLTAGTYADGKFESLYGELPLSTNSTVTFRIAYFEFNCPSVSRYLQNDSWTSVLGNGFIYSNTTAQNAIRRQAQFGSGFFVDTNFTFSSQFELNTAQSILFGSFYNSQTTLWSCVIYTVNRNITLFHAGDDGFGNMGEYLLSMGPGTISNFTPFTDYATASATFSNWPLMDVASLGISSLVEQYIATGYSFNQTLVGLSIIDNITFATRLTTLFNTYIQLEPRCTNGDNSMAAESSCWLNATSSTPLQKFPFILISCNWGFVTILALASMILLFCACLNLWLIRQISTPDILGYVSSLPIENLQKRDDSKATAINSTMDGLQRSKVLGKMKVQIRDVQQEHSVGRFALTSDVRERRKVEEGRKYI